MRIWYFSVLCLMLCCCGCTDDTDSGSDDTHEDTEYQSETTNSDGVATFYDDGEEVIIYVKDQSTDQSLVGVDVDYINGEDFEIFLVSDPDETYHPNVGFFTHNSSHDILLELIDGASDFFLRTIFGTEERAALSNWLEYRLHNDAECPGSSGLFFYNGTYSSSQIADVQTINLNIALFLGSLTGNPAITLVSTLAGAANLDQIIEATYGQYDFNWDKLTHGIPYTQTGFNINIPSVEPIVALHNPTINENIVTLSGNATDNTNYFNTLEEPTQRCLGPTEGSDILYRFAIFGDDLNLISDFTSNPTHTFTNVPAGTFTARAIAYDETNINFDTHERSVTIEEQWTNNGRIAFVRGSSIDSEEIYTMNSDGSNQERLTNNAMRDSSPTWSPDGSMIAFHRRHGSDVNYEIYTMNANGSNQTRLTNNSTLVDAFPSFSQDGSMIAFYRYQDDGNAEIYIMNSDGSNQINVSNHPEGDYDPSWSPDGSSIAFYNHTSGPILDNEDIIVMNSDGSNRINISNKYGDERHPAWSPDGSMIAFDHYQEDGNGEIYTMNSDGSNQVNVSNHPSSDSYPTWSPDGSMITFSSNRDGNTEIYTMNSDGSNVTRLTNSSVFDGRPSWGPE